MFNINFAHDCIQTADLWCRKQLLYQLTHNHFPTVKLFKPEMRKTGDVRSYLLLSDQFRSDLYLQITHLTRDSISGHQFQSEEMKTFVQKSH